MKFKKAAAVLPLLLFSVCLFAQTAHKKRASSTVGLAAVLARGKAVYAQQCLVCHQADATGVPNLNPPLINTTYVLGDKATMIKIVLNGFKDDVEINGKTYTNVMPPHDTMKDQEIADVLTYVRKSFGNKASTITVADVRKARAENKP